MPVRNLDLERQAIGAFGKKYGRLPQTTPEWAEVHKIAYGVNIPEELRSVAEEAQRAAKVLPPKPPIPSPAPGASSLLPQYPELERARTEVERAQAAYQQYQQPTAALSTFQEALRTLGGMRQTPLGESLVFGMAGVGGYGALSSSLNVRLQELKQNSATYEDIIKTMAGVYADTTRSLSESYKTAIDLYNEEADRISDLEKSILEHQQAIELIKLKHDLDTEFENYKNKFKSTKRVTPDLDKLLRNYPLEFKSYIKSVAPGREEYLNEKTIGDAYAQYMDLKAKGILPFGVTIEPKKVKPKWGVVNPKTGKTPEQSFLEMGVTQEMIDMAISIGLTPEDLF